MSAEREIRALRVALAELYVAGVSMPRHAPNPGAASTEHDYRISAAHVWEFDKAMSRASGLLYITDLPRECCVGSRNFNEDMAGVVKENVRKILEVPMSTVT